MEETTQGEDVNLHSADGEAQTDGGQGEPTEKTTYSREEVEAMKKEMQANSDRGVQKILSEKKKYEKVIDGVKLIGQDATALLTINETDPDVARAILDKYYDGKSIEEYQELYEIQVDYSDPKLAKAKIEREANKLATERLVNEKKDEFIAKLKLSEEEITAFNEAFEERRTMKSFDPKEVVKHLEKAYREIDGDPKNLKEMEVQEKIAKTQATGTNNSTTASVKKTALDSSREEARAFLDKFGF